MMTHLRHNSLALKPPPHSVINALWLSPTRVDAFETVGLMAIEGCGALLHDRNVLLCRDHLQTDELAISVFSSEYLEKCRIVEKRTLAAVVC